MNLCDRSRSGEDACGRANVIFPDRDYRWSLTLAAVRTHRGRPSTRDSADQRDAVAVADGVGGGRRDRQCVLATHPPYHAAQDLDVRRLADEHHPSEKIAGWTVGLFCAVARRQAVRSDAAYDAPLLRQSPPIAWHLRSYRHFVHAHHVPDT